MCTNLLSSKLEKYNHGNRGQTRPIILTIILLCALYVITFHAGMRFCMSVGNINGSAL